MRFGFGFALTLPRRRADGSASIPSSSLLGEDGFALTLEDGGLFILE